VNKMHWIAVGGLAGGLILVLVLGWQFLLKPLGLAYEAKAAEKEALEEQLATTKQRAAQFEKFKAQAENVRRDLDFYSRRLDPDLSASELYTLVDGLGHSFNFTNWSFEASKRAKSKMPGVSLDEVEVKARFLTDFEHLGKLLNLCVSQVRIFVPDSFTLTRNNDPSGVFRDTLQAELTLKLLVSPAEGGS
jgi:Tfp pilus assembly protein PilO